jgi:D-alanyl-D-alanine carboxypeptidase
MQMRSAFRDKVTSHAKKFIRNHKAFSFLGVAYTAIAITSYDIMLYFYNNSKRFTCLACILLFFTASSSFSYPAMSLDVSFASDKDYVSKEDSVQSVEILSEKEVAESEAELATTTNVDSKVLKEASEVVNPDAAEVENMASVEEILDAEGAIGTDVEVNDQQKDDNGEITFLSDDWKLVLVNKQHPIPDDYEFELGTISGSMKCDDRVIAPLLSMLKAAKKDGVNLIVCSPYRDIDRQTMLFDNKVDRYMGGGMSYMDAYNLASQAVTVPGSSEHQIGLAVDIITDNYTLLDEGFGDTPAGKWLAENSAEYGFILRYPSGKEEITSIEYEPWHFRYVGPDAASVITENKLCLEEFWNKYVE